MVMFPAPLRCLAHVSELVVICTSFPVKYLHEAVREGSSLLGKPEFSSTW